MSRFVSWLQRRSHLFRDSVNFKRLNSVDKILFTILIMYVYVGCISYVSTWYGGARSSVCFAEQYRSACLFSALNEWAVTPVYPYTSASPHVVLVHTQLGIDISQWSCLLFRNCINTMMDGYGTSVTIPSLHRLISAPGSLRTVHFPAANHTSVLFTTYNTLQFRYTP